MIKILSEKEYDSLIEKIEILGRIATIHQDQITVMTELLDKVSKVIEDLAENDLMINGIDKGDIN